MSGFNLQDLMSQAKRQYDALQKKMQEEREQMKLPAFVGDLRVSNGELIIRPK